MHLKEKTYRVVAVYLALAMVLFAVSACRTPAGRTSGEVVDDAAITTKVKAKLYEDNILRGIAVSVETFDREVTLTGAVDTNEQKTRAEDIAKSVDGVKKVNNLLKIKEK